jgi:hypothetical protein
MTALHPPAAPNASSNVHPEPGHRRAPVGQVDLPLIIHPLNLERPATVRAAPRHQRLEHPIRRPARSAAMAVTAMRVAAAGPATATAHPFENGAACRFPPRRNSSNNLSSSAIRVEPTGYQARAHEQAREAEATPPSARSGSAATRSRTIGHRGVHVQDDA